MKTILHTFGALLLATTAGCFPTRTDALACAVTTDCSDGRSCVAGYCVFDGVDAATPDTMVEIDAPPAEVTCDDEWPDKPDIYDPCQIQKGGPITVTGAATLDTGTGAWTGATGATMGSTTTINGQNVRLFLVESFAVNAGATLRVTGTMPLLVVSFGDISIAGTIDASSNAAVGGTPAIVGGGSNITTCPPLAPGTNGDDGGGGGAGAGFGGAGGAGGQGANGNGAPASAALGVPILAGGCRGGGGGLENTGRTVTIGGAGGGAVYLASRTTITVGAGGVIDVGGAGGEPAKGNNANQGETGGAGGGSGGMIGLDAPTVTVSGTLAANGGGGGGGCDDNSSNPGADGSPNATPAPGGVNNNSGGGNGSAGGAGATPNGVTGVNNNGGDGGGGGGGGGVGIIIVKATTRNLGGTVSPPAR